MYLHVSHYTWRIVSISVISFGCLVRVLDYQRNYYAIRAINCEVNAYINMHGAPIETCVMLVQLVAREFTISHSI